MWYFKVFFTPCENWTAANDVLRIEKDKEMDNYKVVKSWFQLNNTIENPRLQTYLSFRWILRQLWTSRKNPTSVTYNLELHIMLKEKISSTSITKQHTSDLSLNQTLSSEVDNTLMWVMDFACSSRNKKLKIHSQTKHKPYIIHQVIRKEASRMTKISRHFRLWTDKEDVGP